MNNEEKKKISLVDFSNKELNFGGNVDIEVLQNDKVMQKINIHNSGTVAICQYLRDALAGGYVIANRPGIIVPCTRGVGVGPEKLKDVGLGTGLFNDNPTKSLQINDYGSNSSACTLTFLIPSNILSPGTEIVGFKLYSKASKTLFAYIDIPKVKGVGDTEGAITVFPGTNLRVNWTLIVKLEEETTV